MARCDVYLRPRRVRLRFMFEAGCKIENSISSLLVFQLIFTERSFSWILKSVFISSSVREWVRAEEINFVNLPANSVTELFMWIRGILGIPFSCSFFHNPSNVNAVPFHHRRTSKSTQNIISKRLHSYFWGFVSAHVENVEFLFGGKSRMSENLKFPCHPMLERENFQGKRIIYKQKKIMNILFLVVHHFVLI